MSNTFCNHISKGMFVSHRGISVCCVNQDKHKNIMPSEFWKGNVREEALSKMNNKDRVKGCDNCYETENRKMPSSRTFAKLYDHLPTKDLPTMLDLDFSNFCNLKCVMCGPSRSSEWAKSQGGGISSIDTKMIDDLADMSGQVEHLTIQGGEPTIMPEFEYYFEMLEKKGYIGRIEVQMITNATNINLKFYKLLEKFRNVRLSISIDAYGRANDYIRWPSKFEQIEKNIMKISEFDNNIQVEVLNTLNILSMFDYNDFLSWCKRIEKVYTEKGKSFKIVPMKVQQPEHYSPFVAPRPLKQKFTKDVSDFMENNNLTHNSNWKTEMMLLLKAINSKEADQVALSQLRDKIKQLDSERRNIEITNYIPDFYKYM
jgi:organic radical activating enzyme